MDGDSAGPLEADVAFREQEDGQKVGQLPSGKVVLLGKEFTDQVRDGETWRVRLQHRSRYAWATPLHLVAPLEGQTEPASPVREEAADESRAPEPAPPVLVAGTDRVALFLNGRSMEFANREAGFSFDFTKIRTYFTGQGTLVGAFYHAVDRGIENDSRFVPFVDLLTKLGYTVRLKQPKRSQDAEGRERLRYNLDPDFVADIVTTMDNWDVAFLFHGDGEYAGLIQTLRARGKRIYAVTTRYALGRELAMAVDKPIYYLEDLHAVLGRG